MEYNEITELEEKIRTEILNRIDFKNGVLQEISNAERKAGRLLDVRWKRNVHFILHINRWNNNAFWYYAMRNGEMVSGSRYTRKLDDAFFHSVQHLVNEIDAGSFNSKKTVSDRIYEIIQERQLTSCMNDTKWKEFVHAMAEEMPIEIPYDYKTLFEETREKLQFDTHYDNESFNWYHFKSIEWVKVKPKFYEHRHRGLLVEDEKIHHDTEQEFLELMDKYSIPYEYDKTNGLYTIYGYR